MKKVYSSKGGDQAGYPLRDGIGCYTVVEDDELETCLAQGKIYEKDGFYYSDLERLCDQTAPEAAPANAEKPGMFDDPGNKIKSIVKALFIIGCVLSVVGGIVAGIAGSAAYMFYGGQASFNFISFVLSTAVGIFGTYIGCLIIAAIGDIAVNIRELNRKTK